MVSANGPQVADESVPDKRARRRREHRVEQHRRRSNHNRLIDEFQPDAVELERRAVPGGARWTLYTVVALIASAVAWANWAEVDRIVTAQGKLVSVEAPILIDSKLATPIASLNAKFGDRVTAGFVIATMDPTFSDADVKQLEVRRASLQAVIARLKAERGGVEFAITGHEDDRDWLLQKQLFDDRKSEYQAQLNKFNAQNKTFEVQLANNKQEIAANIDSYDVYNEYLVEMKQLRTKGSVSKLQVLQWEQQTKDSKQSILAGASRSKELIQSMATVEAERNAYQASAKTLVVSDLVEALDEQKSIEQDTKKAMRQNQFVELRVPDDLPYKEFVVLERTDNSVGSVMQPGEPLFKLIPLGADMEVEIEIEGKDISRLKSATAEQIASDNIPSGSEVSVKLSSFPYQKHGALEGVVRTIGEGTFEKQTGSGAATGLTMYKARVALDKPYNLKEVTDEFRLMPGMVATAEIKIGTRRVIDYFLYPLIKGSEALREP